MMIATPVNHTAMTIAPIAEITVIETRDEEMTIPGMAALVSGDMEAEVVVEAVEDADTHTLVEAFSVTPFSIISSSVLYPPPHTIQISLKETE